MQLALQTFITENLKTVESKTEHILSLYPETQSDNKLLLYMYYKIFENLEIPELLQVKTNGWSIRRSAQFIRAMNPELRGSKSVQLKRNIMEDELHEYYSPKHMEEV